VILLISDGNGLSQIPSPCYFKETQPNYAGFEHIGLIKTSSSRQDVTDPAASATAFACGVKTYNGAIGVADDSTAVKNVVEYVTAKNIKTGIIATSSLTQATRLVFMRIRTIGDLLRKLPCNCPNHRSIFLPVPDCSILTIERIKRTYWRS
jgi:alkaline phosphatase